MSNHLAKATSPYLQQHADNPVDWFEWGEAAFAEAKKRDVPIFLSIGYSTCHWCHVMAHESFENESIAAILNEHFVAVKVDREERPDIDRVYMTYVQATTGHGGWPMSVFLTTDLVPFFGGTYFPPKDAYGRAGFPTLLQRIAELWNDDREKLLASADKTLAKIREITGASAGDANGFTLEPAAILDATFEQFAAGFDARNGGFGGAPKFPRPAALEFLSAEATRPDSDSGKRHQALAMLVKTLDAISSGGINDQLAGGVHRYAVDAIWHVPHFEKMLYDQAQLVPLYLDAYRLTGEERHAAMARQILDYVLADMTHERGGFFSAEDADSALPEDPTNHGEGAFYTWSHVEITELLNNDENRVFCQCMGIAKGGNVDPSSDPHHEFTGLNIPYRANSPQSEEDNATLHSAIAKLLAVREKRPRPHLDDKILTAWNGLMIAAFARAAVVLDEPRYLTAAQNAATFLRNELLDAESNILRRSWRDGRASIDAFADDHAFLIHGLIDLYQADFDTAWLDWVQFLQTRQIALFHDTDLGGFFSTKGDDKSVLLRMKEDTDNAEPAASSISAQNLQRLAAILQHDEWRDMATSTINAFSHTLENSPTALPRMAVALARSIDNPPSIIIVTDNQQSPLIIAARKHAPSGTTITRVPTNPAERQFFNEHTPLIRNLPETEQAYLCRNHTCSPPVSTAEELNALLTITKSA